MTLSATSRLFRQGSLDFYDWCALLEERAEVLRPLLRDMSLPELGEVKILRSTPTGTTSILDAKEHSLNDDTPEVIVLDPSGQPTQSLSLTYRCFVQSYEDFWFGKGCGFEAEPRSSFTFWGISRSGQWFIGHVSCDVTDGYEKATSVRVMLCDVATMLRLARPLPFSVFQSQGRFYDSFIRYRERLLEYARHKGELLTEQWTIMSARLSVEFEANDGPYSIHTPIEIPPLPESDPA